jgi:hypothetical protein
VVEALMAEQLAGGVLGVRAFIEMFTAPDLTDVEQPTEPEPEWEDWGADPDAQARMEAAMAMMGGGPDE